MESSESVYPIEIGTTSPLGIYEWDITCPMKLEGITKVVYMIPEDSVCVTETDKCTYDPINVTRLFPVISYANRSNFICELYMFKQEEVWT